MKIVFLILTFLSLLTQNAFANLTCKSALLDIDKFFNASIGTMLGTSKSKTTKEHKINQIFNILNDCTEIELISKRVAGRAKWEEMTPNEQDNFLKEYPKYFISNFSDIVLASTANFESYKFTKSRVQQNQSFEQYDVTFIPIEKQNPSLVVTFTLLQKDGRYYITDATFGDAISIVQSQRQLIDSMYQTDSDVLKTFNAKKLLNQK